MTCLVVCPPDRRPLSVETTASWETILADAIHDPAELCQELGLPRSFARDMTEPSAGFPLVVPRPYLARIRPEDLSDPLLRQIMPQAAELVAAAGFQPDPLGETTCQGGLLSKYEGRSLMVAASDCCVHCRFCFRRHFPYPTKAGTLTAWQSALERIAEERSVDEVILSGGDPLTLPDRLLAELARQLADVPHLRRLRVHTRAPIVIPQRVTAELIQWLRGTRLATIVVVHVNHPAEVDAAVAEALTRLVDAGIPLLSQGVLLRGVNDDVGTLAALYRRLIDLRVMPYYLHQLDRVTGAAHFEVPVGRGIELMRELRALLPGYAVPRYVRETRGGRCKELLA